MVDETDDIPQLMTQAEFARHCGVSRAAVSQWKHPDNNILRDDAFTRPGRKGKVIVAVALDQVRRNRDIGQALGNGLTTRTSSPVPETVEGEQATPAPGAGAAQPDDDARPVLPLEREGPGATPDRDGPVESTEMAGPTRSSVETIEDKLKATRLERERLALRRQQEDDALRRGLLMAADDVRDQMSTIAGRMMRVFEGTLPDFASAMAEHFGVPQRDVLHLLKTQFAKVRATAASRERVAVDEARRLSAAEIDLEG